METKEFAAESDLAALRALTDATEIKNQLRLLNADESRVDAELDAALRSQGDLERSLEMLDVLRCAFVSGTRVARNALIPFQTAAWAS
jgi:hypothetical protein